MRVSGHFVFCFFYFIMVSCTGFFRVVPLITRNSRKTHENTKNKYLLGGPLNYPPVPHTKSTKINEIHEKGDRGRSISDTEYKK